MTQMSSLYYVYLQDSGYNFVRFRAFTKKPKGSNTWANLIKFINPDLPEAKKTIVNSSREIVTNQLLFLDYKLVFSINQDSHLSHTIYGYMADNRNVEGQLLGFTIFYDNYAINSYVSITIDTRIWCNDDINKE